MKFISGNLFQYKSIPNGYEPATRIFTKISEVPFEYLKCEGHNLVLHVEASYLPGDLYQSCLTNIS